jgi:2-iminobutanoate/2-iminopropanoate deaminase
LHEKRGAHQAIARAEALVFWRIAEFCMALCILQTRRKDVARMKITSHNAADAPQPTVGHAQVVEVSGATRFAYFSGQVPVTRDGAVPGSFAEQSRLIWRNIQAQLAEIGMTLDNVVKATTFLSDRKYAIENRAIRTEIMGARTRALTVVICGLFDEAWLLEIEVVAAA